MLYFFCNLRSCPLVTYKSGLGNIGAAKLSYFLAVITPVPKVANAKPDSLVEYRPISVTPLLSRLAEKLVVNRWLAPSVPPSIISDQFVFRKTGSTTCALTYLLHHITFMLERMFDVL